MFLRIQCERNSSHSVLKEVFPLGRSLSFPFFLSLQVLNSKARFPGGYLSWLGEHRREQASNALVCPSQSGASPWGVRWGGALKAAICKAVEFPGDDRGLGRVRLWVRQAALEANPYIKTCSVSKASFPYSQLDLNVYQHNDTSWVCPEVFLFLLFKQVLPWG